MLRINDGRGKREELLETVVVSSAGGIPPAYKALVGLLPKEGRVLDYGSWQGLTGLWLRAARPEVSVTLASNSYSWLEQVKQNLEANNYPGTPRGMFPLEGTYETIVMGAHDSSAATAMLAGQAMNCLSPGGQLLLAMTGQAQPPRGFAVLSRGEGWGIYQSKQGLPPEFKELAWQQYNYQVRGQSGKVWTLPGTFSPGGLDQGTRLMLEEAQIPVGARMLDLGCGSGVVGLVCRELGAEPVFMDEDLVALTSCKRNLAERGEGGQVVFSNNPFEVDGKFDLVLTNPPYHTDYSVGANFIEFARRRLKTGGQIYIVVKRADWYQNRLKTVFGGCRVVTRAGYSLLMAENRGPSSLASQEKTTTRKHQRRLAARGKKK